MPKVNRLLLEAEYQAKGELYDDTKTEAAMNILANQIDANDELYKKERANIKTATSRARGV